MRMEEPRRTKQKNNPRKTTTDLTSIESYTQWSGVCVCAWNKNWNNCFEIEIRWETFRVLWHAEGAIVLSLSACVWRAFFACQRLRERICVTRSTHTIIITPNAHCNINGVLNSELSKRRRCRISQELVDVRDSIMTDHPCTMRDTRVFLTQV